MWKGGEGGDILDGLLTGDCRGNHAHSILRKFRQNINSTFYIRYHLAYVPVNNETRVRMVLYKQQLLGSTLLLRRSVIEYPGESALES